ncbi:hypothetical protein U1Q18_051304 [Sarracenia purpurea var. burkii]
MKHFYLFVGLALVIFAINVEGKLENNTLEMADRAKLDDSDAALNDSEDVIDSEEANKIICKPEDLLPKDVEELPIELLELQNSGCDKVGE